MLRHSSPVSLPSSPTVAFGFASFTSALFAFRKCMYAFLAALGSPAAARSAARLRFLLTLPSAFGDFGDFGARRCACLPIRGAPFRAVRPASSSSPSSSPASALKSVSAASSDTLSSSVSSLLSCSSHEAPAVPAGTMPSPASPSSSCALLSSLVSLAFAMRFATITFAFFRGHSGLRCFSFHSLNISLADPSAASGSQVESWYGQSTHLTKYSVPLLRRRCLSMASIS
mmetsp:Transcript_37910/g.62691  ORF Transcript_37910/g.62691 Transcript_37910/m.62691 type:complete len:229 (-) Transcript_37910:9-695(-)